jgi:hypothetical protein
MSVFCAPTPVIATIKHEAIRCQLSGCVAPLAAPLALTSPQVPTPYILNPLALTSPQVKHHHPNLGFLLHRSSAQAESRQHIQCRAPDFPEMAASVSSSSSSPPLRVSTASTCNSSWCRRFSASFALEALDCRSHNTRGRTVLRGCCSAFRGEKPCKKAITEFQSTIYIVSCL